MKHTTTLAAIAGLIDPAFLPGGPALPQRRRKLVKQCPKDAAEQIAKAQAKRARKAERMNRMRTDT